MGSPNVPILLLLFVFVIVLAVTVAVKSSTTGRATVLAGLVLFFVCYFYLRSTPRFPGPAPAIRHSPPVPVPADHDAPRRVLVAERDEPPAVHRIEAPDDLKTWAREGVLDFRPTCSWLAEAISSRAEKVIGDTEFLYWEPVNGRLHGFSGQEADSEAAFRGARRSAQRKLAVLGLVFLKQEDRRVDVASALPLALRRAGELLREEAEHLEKAKRSYGEVCRASVAVRAGSSDLKRLAGAVKEELARGWVVKQRTMTSWLMAIGASLVIGFAIFLFYTFANAGTKGYFAWPLRIASLALFVLLCAGLFYLRVRLGMG